MRTTDVSRSRTIVGTTTNAALVLLALALLGAAVAVFSGAYQVRPVLSSSMTPKLPVGSVVITERVPVTSVRAHDVIVFHDPYNPSKLVVHRIATIQRDGGATTITTKGDANAVPDPWKVNLRGDTSYRVVGDIPVVGYLAVWVHQPAIANHMVPVGLGVGALALAVLFWPRRKTEGDDQVEAPDDAEASPQDQPSGAHEDVKTWLGFAPASADVTAQDPIAAEPDPRLREPDAVARQPVTR